MNDRMVDRVDRATDVADTQTRRMVSTAQDVAERAGAYMQARMGEMSERAQDLAHTASARMEQLTGRPMASWSGDARRLVRDHPLKAIAAMIGLGYVLGKLMSRD